MQGKERRGAGPGREAIKAWKERLLRDQRELARELQERVQRQAIPQKDDGPLPRID